LFQEINGGRGDIEPVLEGIQECENAGFDSIKINAKQALAIRKNIITATAKTFQPDLFIVYSGHNEFLERRTFDKLLKTPEFVRHLGALASRMRLYSALYDVTYERDAVLPTEVEALLDRSVGIRLD